MRRGSRMGFDIVNFVISNRPLLDQIIDMVPIPIFIKDEDGRYIDCNNAFTAFLAMPREKIIGKSARDMWKREEAEVFSAQDEELSSAGGSRVYETRLTSADGAPHIVQFHKKVVTDAAGKRLGIIGAIFDITDQKAKEARIEQLLREKETILHEAHHRIKNNMSTVMGLISLRIGSGIPEEARVVLEEAATQIGGMALLYDKLYRSQSTEDIVLGDYLSDLLGEAKGLFADGSGIEVEVAVPEIRVSAKNASNLGIIFNELLTNSAKYAFGSTASPRVAVTGTVEKDRIILDYRDNGRGLPAGFDLESSNGFGIGVIREVASSLGGCVERLRTEVGAAFRIRLPRALSLRAGAA
jgi:PAS domain S-box-containing protein